VLSMAFPRHINPPENHLAKRTLIIRVFDEGAVVMNDKEKFALIPKSSSALENAEPSKKRILSGMVGDTLALATSIFRIGDCVLREPDYRQVTIWAEQLRLTPAETLRRLKQGLRAKGNETRVENGRFTALNWDAGLLHGSDFQMSIELELSKLSFAPMDVIADSCDGEAASQIG